MTEPQPRGKGNRTVYIEKEKEIKRLKAEVEDLEAENRKQRRQISQMFNTIENWKHSSNSLDNQLNSALRELDQLRAEKIVS